MPGAHPLVIKRAANEKDSIVDFKVMLIKVCLPDNNSSHNPVTWHFDVSATCLIQ